MSLLGAGPIAISLVLFCLATIALILLWSKLASRTIAAFALRLICLITYGAITVIAATLALNIKYRWYDL